MAGGSELPISDATLQRLRQLLAPDFAAAVRSGAASGSATAIAAAAAAAAALYEPLNPGIAQKVYVNGILSNNPIIASGASNVTSTGAAGTYSLNYGVTFASVSVAAMAGVDQSNGNAVILTIISLGTTSFGFDMIELIPAGSQVVPSGHLVTVSWVAVGA